MLGRSAFYLLLSLTAACTTRAAHIPDPAPSSRDRSDAADLSHEQPGPAGDPSAWPMARLRSPLSRARVLEVLSRFQSSIASGTPPLEELLARQARLTVPGADGRVSSPSRSAIVGALGAHFVDPMLDYDPLEVSVRSSERVGAGASEGLVVASIPLQTASSSARRLVLALKVGYDAGALRIVDIRLSPAP